MGEGEVDLRCHHGEIHIFSSKEINFYFYNFHINIFLMIFFNDMVFLTSTLLNILFYKMVMMTSIKKLISVLGGVKNMIREKLIFKNN